MIQYLDLFTEAKSRRKKNYQASSPIKKASLYYIGYDPGFHKYSIYNGERDISMTKKSLRMGKKVCEDWGYSADSLYKKVYDNEWTIDKFTAMVDGIYTDNNGNGEKDKDDTFGIGTNRCDTIDVWLSAFDQPVTGRDEDGFMTIALVDEKTVNVLEKLIALLNRSPGAFLQYAETWDERNYFKQDRLAFCPLSFHECFSTLREMESAYGILPMPKKDEAQPAHISYAQPWVVVSPVIPVTVTGDGLTMTGTLTDAMAAYGYDYLRPAVFDNVIQMKGTRDEQSAGIVNSLFDNVTFELATIYGFGSFYTTFTNAFENNQTASLMSVWAKVRKGADKELARISETYDAVAEKLAGN